MIESTKNGPLRILHVFGLLDKGGAESRTMEIYRTIDRSKIQFDFAVHSESKGFFEDEARSLGANIYRMPPFTGFNLGSYFFRWKTLFNDHPEIAGIHGHMTSTAFLYLYAAKLKGIPLRIAHARSAGARSKSRQLATRLAPLSATHLFAVSAEAGSYQFGNSLKRKKYSIVPNGIDVAQYAFSEEERKCVRDELDIGEECFAIGSVGRLIPSKNFEHLIKLLPILNQQKTCALILAGDGPERERLQNLAKSIGVQSKVLFLGERTDIPALLSAFDIFVLPSLYEGLPGVVLEAQANGLHCLLSDHITKEVNLTGNVSFLSVTDKSDLWVRALLTTSRERDRDASNKLLTLGYDAKMLAEAYSVFYKTNC